jgi:hypothetical protein
MDRRDERRYPRSTKDDLLNEGRGVEAPRDDAPYRRDDHDEHGGEAIGAGAGALGGAVGAAGGAGLGDKAEEDIEDDRRTVFDRNR